MLTVEAMTTEKTITGLNLEKGSKNRVAVSLDGLEGFSLSLTAAAGLRKGQILSAKDMERLKKEDARQEAYNQAVRYLALRTRSRKETESYLAGKGCERRIIEDTLERLVEHKYLDDRALARLWVENRDRFKPRSVYALRYELKKKGIEDDLIDGVLADFDEEASAWSLVQGSSGPGKTWRKGI